MVQPQMTVLLDGGSTVVYTAQQIVARPIQVVTNSLAVAGIFADDDQVELLVIGGNLYPRTGVLVGSIATGCLADLHADVLLFSLAGIFGNEAFNQNLMMAQVEQAMLRQAVVSMMLMDSSKFGRKSLARVCGLEEVDHIITDAGVDQTWRDQLGHRLVTVPDASDGGT
jgi:DeoR/GlpR family transcriptional regulator of sugar metabolism